jgi:hypothetical protein
MFWPSPSRSLERVWLIALPGMAPAAIADAEGPNGEFHPHIFGWMVHAYPNEKDPRKIWSTDDDEQGHDNMDHSAMPGMKTP